MLLYTLKNVLLIAILFVLVAAISCKKNDHSEKVITMNVAPKLIKGGAASPSSHTYKKPMEDGPIETYKLIEVVSKTKVYIP